ncbi:MAG: ABC transporter permease [Actinobacteria bacterium]|nr:ABC transporter permease [Actinomycetota bacterium]
MKTFSAYFKKEILEAIRTNKYLILFIGSVFWALMAPLILKLLPLFLKSLPIDLSAVFEDFNRDAAYLSFLGDFFVVGTLFFALTLMGIISNEVYYKRLVFPYSSGANTTGMVIAKYIHYGCTFSVFILIGFLTNYFYTNRLFEGGILEIGMVIRSALLYMIYYAFLLSLLIFLSSLFRKGIIAGITVIILGYTLSIFNQVTKIRVYLPNYLLFKAADIGNIFDSTLFPTIIISVVLIVAFLFFSILRIKKLDIA